MSKVYPSPKHVKPKITNATKSIILIWHPPPPIFFITSKCNRRVRMPSQESRTAYRYGKSIFEFYHISSIQKRDFYKTQKPPAQFSLSRRFKIILIFLMELSKTLEIPSEAHPENAFSILSGCELRPGIHCISSFSESDLRERNNCE